MNVKLKPVLNKASLAYGLIKPKLLSKLNAFLVQIFQFSFIYHLFYFVVYVYLSSTRFAVVVIKF